MYVFFLRVPFCLLKNTIIIIKQSSIVNVDLFLTVTWVMYHF